MLIPPTRIESAVHAISDSIARGESLVITPQIAAEFWNVATRPTGKNGLGMTTDEAREEIVRLRLEGFFSVVDESAAVYAEWKRLVVAHSVHGVQVHDARLVAAMNVYGIRRIITFNIDDFERYEGIEATRPS